MTILTQELDAEQMVDAGIRNGIRHEVISNAGYGFHFTRCGKIIQRDNMVCYKLPRKHINCAECHLGNDADFEARREAADIKNEMEGYANGGN